MKRVFNKIVANLTCRLDAPPKKVAPYLEALDQRCDRAFSQNAYLDRLALEIIAGIAPDHAGSCVDLGSPLPRDVLVKLIENSLCSNTTEQRLDICAALSCVDFELPRDRYDHVPAIRDEILKAIDRNINVDGVFLGIDPYKKGTHLLRLSEAMEPLGIETRIVVGQPLLGVCSSFMQFESKDGNCIISKILQSPYAPAQPYYARIENN